MPSKNPDNSPQKPTPQPVEKPAEPKTTPPKIIITRSGEEARENVLDLTKNKPL